MSDGEFSVWLFFRNDTNAPHIEHVDAKTAVETAKRLTTSVAARLGYVVRIIITNGDDNTSFMWEYGKGVTYPRRADGGQIA